jgi:hypothetical protein
MVTCFPILGSGKRQTQAKLLVGHFLSSGLRSKCRENPAFSAYFGNNAAEFLCSVRPWAHEQNAEGTQGIMRRRGLWVTGRVNSGAHCRARSCSVAPGDVIRTVVTPGAARRLGVPIGRVLTLTTRTLAPANRPRSQRCRGKNQARRTRGLPCPF